MGKTWVLKKVKVNDETQDVIAKSTDEHITVNYNGQKMTLASALERIKEEIKEIPNIADEQFATDSEIRDIFGI